MLKTTTSASKTQAPVDTGANKNGSRALRRSLVPVRVSATLVFATLVSAALVSATLVSAALVSGALLSEVAPALTCFDLSTQALAKGAKPTKGRASAAATPRQLIFSLSQDQQNSELLKIWGVPACVLMGKERPRGIYVTGFTGDGLGNQLGLEVGDVLLSLNGHVVIDAKQADQIIGRTRSGQLQAVVARASSTAGGIKVLSPRISFSADSLPGTYASSGGESGGRSAGSSRSSGISPGTSSQMSQSALEDYMFGLVNEDRRKNGNVHPVTKSSSLSSLARKYAEDMRDRNFFAHEDPEGLDPRGRAAKAGIYASVWENLATEMGTNDYRNLVWRCQKRMMDEPPGIETNHRGNILREKHQCVGIGVAVGNRRVWCVQEFSSNDVP